jgi:hypothetical protein
MVAARINTASLKNSDIGNDVEKMVVIGTHII